MKLASVAFALALFSGACGSLDDPPDADAGPPDAAPDPCEALTCDANAACVVTGGVGDCVCNAGYEGSGETCTDIDECTTAPDDDCDPNATCTNTPGAFTCACNDGYEGDGTTCADIDECTAGTDNCDTNATCANSDGSFTCTCNDGYIGDGVTCDPIPPAVLSFPSAGDTHIPVGGPMWHMGDYVQGVRATSLTQATSASLHVVIASNGLTCDTQDHKVMLNGTQVGTFMIAAGNTVVDTVMTFPVVMAPGGSWTIRYETISTVAGGCGAADIPLGAGSTITLYW